MAELHNNAFKNENDVQGRHHRRHRQRRCRVFTRCCHTHRGQERTEVLTRGHRANASAGKARRTPRAKTTTNIGQGAATVPSTGSGHTNHRSRHGRGPSGLERARSTGDAAARQHHPRNWRLHHWIRPREPRNRRRPPHHRREQRPPPRPGGLKRRSAPATNAPAATEGGSPGRSPPRTRRPRRRTAAIPTARRPQAGSGHAIHGSGQATAGSSLADQNARAPTRCSHRAAAHQRQRTSPPPSSRAARAFPSVVFGSDQGREGG